MGDLTRLVITGASGFVGRACVAEARRRGAQVIAVVRRNRLPHWRDDPGITVVETDLSDASCVDVLGPLIGSDDAIIHAAAHMGGTAVQHQSGTVQGTRHVLQAAGQARIVLVSSIAIYDTMQLSPGDPLTEATPLEQPDRAHDVYAQAKLHQEALSSDRGGPLWILRPGAIYGDGQTWNALMGFGMGKLFVHIRSDGVLPIVHVDHAARALVAAAFTDPGGVQAINVIDDDLPTRARYLGAHRTATGWPARQAAVPYQVWRRIAALTKPLGAMRPGLLREPVLRARLMPLYYPNAALRAALGGQDNAPFEQMLQASVPKGAGGTT